jgi:hypothetical protein
MKKMSNLTMHKITVDTSTFDELETLSKTLDTKLGTLMTEFGNTFIENMIAKSPVKSGLMMRSWKNRGSKRVRKTVTNQVDNTAVRTIGKRSPFPYPYVIEHSGWKDSRGSFHKPLMHEEDAIKDAERVLLNEICKLVLKTDDK